MSSAICFNLDQSIILSSGDELMGIDIFYKLMKDHCRNIIYFNTPLLIIHLSAFETLMYIIEN